jgi:hypothetical protein
MTIRIAVRSFSGDCLRHLYRVDQLDNPAREYLIPACREFPYPHRHPRAMVSQTDLPELGYSFVSCPSCAVWSRRNRHTMTVRGNLGSTAA